MNEIRLNLETLTPAKADASEVGQFFAARITHTIEIDLGAQTITAYAYASDDYISIYGFVGSYRTSSKLWRVSVLRTPAGDLNVHFGRDDRSGNFQKLRGVSWNPKAFFAL